MQRFVIDDDKLSPDGSACGTERRFVTLQWGGGEAVDSFYLQIVNSFILLLLPKNLPSDVVVHGRYVIKIACERIHMNSVHILGVRIFGRNLESLQQLPKGRVSHGVSMTDPTITA